MRLINSRNLELRDFINERTPSYAILSHTWEAEEVSFAEWNEIQANPEAERARKLREKSGYIKIAKFCDLCQEGVPMCKHQSCLGSSECLVGAVANSICCSNAEGLCQCEPETIGWVWADTCCIDKSSSSELSEAINSMFSWYRKAWICIVYLSDVPSGDNVADESSSFRKSRWFSRGWTLQELIADSEGGAIFYSKEWAFLGSTRLAQKTLHKLSVIHDESQQVSQRSSEDQAQLDQGLTQGEPSKNLILASSGQS